MALFHIHIVKILYYYLRVREIKHICLSNGKFVISISQKKIPFNNSLEENFTYSLDTSIALIRRYVTDQQLSKNLEFSFYSKQYITSVKLAGFIGILCVRLIAWTMWCSIKSTCRRLFLCAKQIIHGKPS